jgi:hypothetical protein
MKKTLAVMAAFALVAGIYGYASAHQGQGRGWGKGNGPGSCWEDRGSRGWGDDSREQGRRGGRDCGPGNCRNLEVSAGEVENAEAAAAIVETMLERRSNPNLKVGAVTEAGRDFEVEIVTKDGSLANKLFVEKRTGRIIPAYR